MSTTGFFTKRNLITALKSFGVMLIILVLILFVGTSALSEGMLGLVLFTAFIAVFLLSAYMDGLIKGQDESKLAARLENQAARTGKPLDEDEKASCFNPKKGLAVAMLLLIPGIALSVASLVTGDASLGVRIVTRMYFVPYIRLLTDELSPMTSCLLYFVFSLLYPAAYFSGYMRGPAAHAKITRQLRQNDEDYKNGIRKRRRSKPRRGFFG